MRFQDTAAPRGASPWVAGAGPTCEVAVVDPDPAWPRLFQVIADRVRSALGRNALAIEHIGSTSVARLAAKPIVDVDLIVEDSAEEATYVSQLERVGFRLVVREPWWYQHRCMRGADPACNLHVFSPECPEVARHIIFRDWLRDNPADRQLYEDAKRAAAVATARIGGDVEDYNAHKQDVVRQIYARAFAGGQLADRVVLPQR